MTTPLELRIPSDWKLSETERETGRYWTDRILAYRFGRPDPDAIDDTAGEHDDR